VRKINFKIIMEETRENIMISATTPATIDNKFKKKKTCYNCRKKGHLKRECRYKKKQKKEDTKVPNSTNVIENETSEIIAMISEMHISMITELHMAASTKSFDWWYDSGTTIHVCNDKSQFKIYEEAVDG
jgi:hypothetical protein